MNISIVDLLYPIKSTAVGVAGEWLRWAARRHGMKETDRIDADVVLASCVSATQVSKLRSLKKTISKKQVLIVGGPGAYAPHTLGLAVDGVCVGEGVEFINALSHSIDKALALPCMWINGATNIVTPNIVFPWDMPPIEREAGDISIAISRGCKRMCAFCSTTWSVPYQEHPTPDSVIRTAKAVCAAGHKPSYLTNDLSSVSWAHRLPETGSSSISIGSLKSGLLPPSRSVRLGIEGVSARIRSAIGKPISHKDLVGCSAWLSQNKKGVRWFLIVGCPGENSDDWEELKAAICDWKRLAPKGVLQISFTALHRFPSTAMAYAPFDETYWDRLTAFRSWFFDGPGFSRRVKLIFPQQPQHAIETDVAEMGVSKKVLLEGATVSPNDRVRYYRQGLRTKVWDRYKRVMGL